MFVINQKSNWISNLIFNLFAPGAGLMGAGAIREGAVTLIAFFTFIIVLPFATFEKGINPLKSAIVTVLIYLFLQLSCLTNLLQSRRVSRGLKLPYLLAVVIFFLLFSAAGNYLLITHRFSFYSVENLNTFPMLKRGDIVLVRKIYNRENLRKGDVVLVRQVDGDDFISRIIATPGDTVELREGKPVVNGKPLPRKKLGRLNFDKGFYSDPLEVNGITSYQEESGPTFYLIFYRSSVEEMDMEPVKLGDREYFLLADNRTTIHSLDSRKKGAVKAGEIAGYPLRVVFSHNEEKLADIRRIGLKIE